MNKLHTGKYNFRNFTSGKYPASLHI